jgi:hypothetical protein
MDNVFVNKISGVHHGPFELLDLTVADNVFVVPDTQTTTLCL